MSFLMESMSTDYSLYNCLSHEILNDLNYGLMDKYKKNDPFEYLFFEDLLNLNVYQQISNRNNSMQFTKMPDLELKTVASRRNYTPFMDFDAIKFFLGSEFRCFISDLVGQKLVVTRDAIPQIVDYECESPGVPIHNDETSLFEYAAFLYFNSKWHEGMGGELALWAKNSKINCFDLIKKIPPKSNSFVMIKCTNNSWHSVEKLIGNWTRRSIFLQYKIKK
jgi:2OG-Fe(II) oxygenase superfamily